MSRPVLEVADIFRDHGAAWRKANAGHVSLGQLKVMSAIESCRTAALAQSASGACRSLRASGVRMVSGGPGSRRRARMLRMTSAE